MMFPLSVFGGLSRWFQGSVTGGPEHQPKARDKSGRVQQLAVVGTPPSDLLECAGDGGCVVFAGEELSHASGMPTWKTFVLGFIDRLYDGLLLAPAQADAARAAHRRGECDNVSRKLAPFAQANRDVVNEFALALYRKPAALTQIHDAVAGVGACAFVTPNLDGLLERCFGIAEADAFTPVESGDAASRLLRRQFVGMKLRGSFHRPQSLHVWPSEAQASNAENGALRRFLGAILSNHSIVFVGASLDEMEAWLGPADLPSRPTRNHYALIAKTEAHPLKRTNALAHRFNIHCLTYAPDNPTPVIEFLSKLKARPEQGTDSPLTAATSPSKT